MRLNLAHLLIPRDTVTLGEKLIAALGCFLAIFVVSGTSHYFLAGTGLTLMVASMGASAILLFAVPHSPFSLPWPVVGGQVTSALVGVTIALAVPDPVLGLALAVALAGLAMHLLRCLHPPGGATAAAAVLGGDAVRELGLQFAWMPVGANALIIVTMALVLNNLFPRRHYPAALKPWPEPTQSTGEQGGEPVLAPGDLVSAMKQLNIFVDVDEDDLAHIYALASERARMPVLDSDEIQVGTCYSNGRYGDEWSVRQVVDESRTGRDLADGDLITYRVVAGHGRGQRGRCTRRELAGWARYRVCRNENSWRRIGYEAPASAGWG